MTPSHCSPRRARIGQVFGSQRVPTSANLAAAANAAAHGVRAASSDSHGH